MTDRRNTVKRWRDGGVKSCEMNTELNDQKNKERK